MCNLSGLAEIIQIQEIRRKTKLAAVLVRPGSQRRSRRHLLAAAAFQIAPVVDDRELQLNELVAAARDVGDTRAGLLILLWGRACKFER